LTPVSPRSRFIREFATTPERANSSSVSRFMFLAHQSNWGFNIVLAELNELHAVVRTWLNGLLTPSSFAHECKDFAKVIAALAGTRASARSGPRFLQAKMPKDAAIRKRQGRTSKLNKLIGHRQEGARQANSQKTWNYLDDDFSQKDRAHERRSNCRSTCRLELAIHRHRTG
jgi:hypothetical protein